MRPSAERVPWWPALVLVFASSCWRSTVGAAPRTLETPAGYLAPAQMGGHALCLDPWSETARAAFRQKVSADTVVDPAALAEDLPWLWHVLEQRYAGFQELLRAPASEPLAALFARWAGSLRGAATKVTLREAVVPWAVALRERLYDQHLRPSGLGALVRDAPSLVVAEFSAPGSLAGLSGCVPTGGEAWFPDTLREAVELDASGAPRPVVVASARGSFERFTLRCGEVERTLERRARAVGTLPDAAYGFERRGDTALITSRRLYGSPAEEQVLATLPTDYPRHAGARRIVFDLRGNGGGDDAPLLDWAVRAGRSPFQGVVDVTDAATVPCERWNPLAASLAQQGLVETPDVEAQLRQAQQLVRQTPIASRVRIRPGLLTPDGRAPFAGQVIILVDRATASSGESGAEAIAAMTGAVLVGERTGGFLEYGNVQRHVLPRTGLVWDIPTKRNLYDERREGVGLPVDVYLPPALVRAPIETLWPMLERLSRGPGGVSVAPAAK